jgi:hypothetical protein
MVMAPGFSLWLPAAHAKEALPQRLQPVSRQAAIKQSAKNGRK